MDFNIPSLQQPRAPHRLHKQSIRSIEALQRLGVWDEVDVGAPNLAYTIRNQYYKCHCDKSQTSKITGTTKPYQHMHTRQYNFQHAYLPYNVQNLPCMYAKQLAVLNRDLSVACVSACVRVHVFVFLSFTFHFNYICIMSSYSANIFTHFKISDDENNGMRADVIGGECLCLCLC